MTYNDTPQGSGFHTPTTNLDFHYLPSPPVTPIFKRIKTDPEREVTLDQIFQFAPSSDEISSITNVPRSEKARRGRPVGSRNSTKDPGRKPRSPQTTATSKKVSVRRQLAMTHKIPKRIGGSKSTLFTPVQSGAVTPKDSKIKIKKETCDDVTYLPNFANAVKQLPEQKKNQWKNVKGRITNNSLSTTI